MGRHEQEVEDVCDDCASPSFAETTSRKLSRWRVASMSSNDRRRLDAIPRAHGRSVGHVPGALEPEGDQAVQKHRDRGRAQDGPAATSLRFRKDEAKDKVMMGAERCSMFINEQEKKTTARHEAGYALVANLLEKNSDPIHKVAILPRSSHVNWVVLPPHLPTRARTQPRHPSSHR